MASFYKSAAAVCLVALYGLQSEASGTTITYKFNPVVVDDACYLAANFARNGKLPVHISAVEKDIDIVSALTDKVQTHTTEKVEDAVSDATCSALMEAAKLKDIFHYTFEYTDNAAENSLNYRELLQKALDAGLKVFTKTEYQSQWETIWADDAGGSLAHLLGANSTTIGCVIGQCTTKSSAGGGGRTLTASPTGKAVLFCELKPAADKGKAPFDDEYFKGLVERTAKLTEMAEEDLKAPTNDGIAVPALSTILAAGLVAMLAVVSA
ncbi:SAG family member [Eimeria brunetti]|uniref:SAG family member n=1 Tax=Eimeria brunetti TaxID=51314 RepID=U6LAQ6_9EIME|nr:SAG family member [Eimeria brunetti]